MPNGTQEWEVPNGTDAVDSVPNGIGEEGSMRKEEGVPNGTARKCSKWNRRRGKK